MKVYHLNCVKIESPFGSAVGHCVLIENNGSLTLIDAGNGLEETRDPIKKLGKELVENAGFQFDEKLTAIHQIKQLGLNPEDVTDIVCSHLDPDHIGGAADFPKARLHLSKEEFESFQKGDERYFPQQLSYGPEYKLYDTNDSNWFDFPARKLDLSFETYLIPLFGHTLGHCGVVFQFNNRWTFYVGDTYYLKAELDNKNHPVDQLATIRAMDNPARLESLSKIRTFIQKHGHEIEYFGYHDPLELKEEILATNNVYS